MKKRPVTVYELELVSWSPPQALIRVRCSAGTYIRSLARDIAHVCGSCAHLCALNRSAVGPFRLEAAVKVEGEENDLHKALLPIDKEWVYANVLKDY